MKQLLILPAALVFGMTYLAAAQAAESKIEVQGAGEDQHIHKVVVFYGAEGEESKRITLDGGMVTKRGRKTRRAVQALASEDRNRVVAVEEDRDADEHNPYVTRFASAAFVSLYDASGKKLCSTQTRAVPRKISKDGRAFVAIDQGIAPETFEVMHDVPGLQSIADLKGDTSLTDSYLEVLNDSCQVIFSTVGTKGGWNEELISPSGRWLAYEQFESQVATEHGWEYYMTVVDIQTGKSWTFDHGKIIPKRISDAGILTGTQYLGESPTLYDYAAPNGKKYKMHKSRVQHFEWKPGMTVFLPAGSEVEEEK